MASVAITVGEGDMLLVLKEISIKEESTYFARVDGQTIILVVDGSTVNSDPAALTNIKSIGVVALALALGVVDGYSIDVEMIRQNAEALNGSVIDLKTVDRRLLKLVSSKEFRFCLSSVASLAVPPTLATTIKSGTFVLFDSDALA